MLDYLTSGSLAYLFETMDLSESIMASRTIPRPKQNDLCGGDIAIENTAAIASVDALRQFLSFDAATVRACLRSVSRIDLNHCTTGPHSLVTQHIDEATPGNIVDLACQHSSGKAFDVQFLNGNRSEPRCERCADLVQVRLSRPRDPGVKGCQPIFNLAPPL